MCDCYTIYYTLGLSSCVNGPTSSNTFMSVFNASFSAAISHQFCGNSYHYQVKVEDIDCPECHRFVAATRFAPHLEKCMGM